MNIQDVGPLRLAAQHITTPVDTPEQAVEHLLAMQSQDFKGGLWSIGVRMKRPSKRAVEQAIADRLIVRTWPMRGTLHFMHANDVYWMLDLLAARATAAAKSRRINQLGLTDAIVDEAEVLLRNALKGGKSIVRGDVVTLLKDVKGIAIDNQHTQHLMRHFGERGVICFGPQSGKQPTFVLLEEWVPRPPAKPREEALVELARRYFISHGPATLKDFAGWGMMKMTDARFGLEGALPDLAADEIDGIPVYFAPGLKPVALDHPLLLAGFDEYILGYKDRSAMLAPEHSGKIVPGNNGMFLATVVNDGSVVGLWKKKVKTKGVEHSFEMFDGSELPAGIAARAYDEFLRD